VHGSSWGYVFGCYLLSSLKTARQPPSCSISDPLSRDKWSGHDPVLNIWTSPARRNEPNPLPPCHLVSSWLLLLLVLSLLSNHRV
ncbi:hypothetical protein B0H65DRAFT_433207, partial [Neurospora tetraspora]